MLIWLAGGSVSLCHPSRESGCERCCSAVARVVRKLLHLMSIADECSPKLSSILEADESYVLRVLVADIVRELLHSGTERAILKSSPGSQKIIDEFPVAKEADPVWMSRAVDHLSNTDVGRAFSEKYDHSAVI